MDTFYIKLSSSRAGSNAKSSSFETQLSTPLDFSKDVYMVGLVDFSIECNMYNVSENEEVCYWIYKPNATDYYEKRGYEYWSVPKGYYKNIESIVAIINKRLEELTALSQEFEEVDEKILSTPTFYFDATKQLAFPRIVLARNQLVFPIISENLAKIIGFPKTQYETLVKSFLKKVKEENLDLHMNNIIDHFDAPLLSLPYRNGELFSVKLVHVLTNVCNSVAFGNSYMKTLRTIPLKRYNFGDTLYYQFKEINYLPVSESRIEKIQIDLIDQTFKHLKNTNAEVFLTLAFKKVSLKILKTEPTQTFVETQEKNDKNIELIHPVNKDILENLFKRS